MNLIKKGKAVIKKYYSLIILDLTENIYYILK